MATDGWNLGRATGTELWLNVCNQLGIFHVLKDLYRNDEGIRPFTVAL